MAAPIGPGDWVQCVTSVGPDSFGNRIFAGSVYCVELIAPFSDLPGSPDGFGVKLVGIGNANCLWGPERFTPLGGNRADLIESLKAPPIKAPAREPA
jgi:hypothetical protein